LSSAAGTRDAVRKLAHLHGIQLSYTAQGGRRVRASTDALLATLDALGAGVSTQTDIEERIAQITHERHQQLLEPVMVMSGDGALSSPVTLPASSDLSRCQLTVTTEAGEIVTRRLAEVAVGLPRTSDRLTGRGALAVDLSGLQLPAGYHDLAIDGAGIAAAALLLVPPRRSPTTDRSLGVFAPTYALRGQSDWGVGSFSDLARLADHVGALGAELVGTLPMFPIFFTPPVDPSPYLPVSRLFVNEIFIDVESLPEFATSHQARAAAGSADFVRDLAGLREQSRVDYAEVMAHKRRVLELCAEDLFGTATSRRDAFEAFLAGHPELASYADFRAAGERLGGGWRDWSTTPGSLPAEAIDPATRRYHLYAQFAAAEQLAATAEPAGGPRAGLYLDLPVGVHPDGYDTWSQPEVFAPATVGAPPDRLAPQGQAWGFPPLHPDRLRHDRYRYVISCYRHLFAHARAIRIDHVLGLQRLFWIPEGAGAESGAYVRYRSQELLAIVALEATRANAVVVGEDLGTVSAEIRNAMDCNDMLHSFVYQFVATAKDPYPQPRSPSLASLGSHDLPRFAAFWDGADIDDRVARGVTSEPAGSAEHADRQLLVDAVEATLTDRSAAGALLACLGSLAEGPAACVMIDLADVEGETEPDNRPGTGPEADNWRHRLTRPLDAIIDDDRVTDALVTIRAQRRLTDTQGVSA
jgi:4-alpha-glucanotransferase